MINVLVGLILLAVLVYGSLIMGYFAGYRDGHLKGLSSSLQIDNNCYQKVMSDLKSGVLNEQK